MSVERGGPAQPEEPQQPKRELFIEGDRQKGRGFSSTPTEEGGKDAEEREGALRAQFERTICTVLGENPDEPEERFSGRWRLRMALSPYLSEYPFLAGDIDTVARLRDNLARAVDLSQLRYASGAFDTETSLAQQERDRQLRTILDETKAKFLERKSEDTP